MIYLNFTDWLIPPLKTTNKGVWPEESLKKKKKISVMALYYGNHKLEAYLHHRSQDGGKHALFFGV